MNFFKEVECHSKLKYLLISHSHVNIYNKFNSILETVLWIFILSYPIKHRTEQTLPHYTFASPQWSLYLSHFTCWCAHTVSANISNLPNHASHTVSSSCSTRARSAWSKRSKKSVPVPNQHQSTSSRNNQCWLQWQHSFAHLDPYRWKLQYIPRCDSCCWNPRSFRRRSREELFWFSCASKFHWVRSNRLPSQPWVFFFKF